MPTEEVTGDKQALKDSPRTMERKPFGGGTVQVSGDQAPLKSTPTPDQFMKKGINDGQMQVVGDKVSLNDTPRRGWQSHETPMSKQADFMDKV